MNYYAGSVTPKTANLRARLVVLLQHEPEGIRLAELTHMLNVAVRGMEKHLDALRKEGLAGWAQIGNTRKWTAIEHLPALVVEGARVKRTHQLEGEKRRAARRRKVRPEIIPAPVPEKRVQPLERPRNVIRVWSKNSTWTPPAPLIPSIWHYAQAVAA